MSPTERVRRNEGGAWIRILRRVNGPPGHPRRAVVGPTALGALVCVAQLSMGATGVSAQAAVAFPGSLVPDPAATQAWTSADPAAPLVISLQEQLAEERGRSRTELVVVGLVGSLAGLYVGGALGYRLDQARDVPSEDPGLAGAILGALAGSAVLAPTFVYLGNHGAGSLGSAFGGSVLGTVAGLMVAATLGGPEPLGLAVYSLAQALGSTWSLDH